MEKLEASWTGGARERTWPAWCWGARRCWPAFLTGSPAFDPAWIAIVLCGVPIVLEAVIGLVTAFDIKADVLVSLASSLGCALGRTLPPGRWLHHAAGGPGWRT